MADAGAITEQQVVATYKAMRSEVRQLAEKIAELEVEIAEHERVLQTLKDLPPTRKAFRMVGGVLVERTVAEVLPAVTSNRDGIAQVLAQLSENIKQKEKSADEWQVRRLSLALATCDHDDELQLREKLLLAQLLTCSHSLCICTMLTPTAQVQHPDPAVRSR